MLSLLSMSEDPHKWETFRTGEAFSTNQLTKDHKATQGSKTSIQSFDGFLTVIVIPAFGGA